MANTTNFGWETPDDTDLVKDGAAAMRTLGSAIDTSMMDLKGGTSGQILSKNSNTDMDFVWIANDQGDITGVTAGTGISGGGTSGSVTITNSMATAIDAKGDLIVGTGADAFDRLAVGTNGYVLTADSTATNGIKWAAAAGGGKVLQVVEGSSTTEKAIATTTLTDTNLTATITPSSTASKILVLVNQNVWHSRVNKETWVIAALLRGSTTLTQNDYASYTYVDYNATLTVLSLAGQISMSYLDSPSTTSATTYKIQGALGTTTNSANSKWQLASARSSIILIEIGA